MGKLFVIGIGPGALNCLTPMARNIIINSDLIVGYTAYIKLIENLIIDKNIFETGMTGEVERCKYAIEKVREGKVVSVISSGDAGLYGMAGLIFELAPDLDIEVIPGVSSVFAAAAKLGAPLVHDTALISLSDRLTNYDLIMKRIKLASEGDFVIAIYNPKSKTRIKHIEEAVNIIRQFRKDSTPVGIGTNITRENESVYITTLSEINYDLIDMFTIIIIGNSNSVKIGNKIITPRGYKIN